MNQKTLPLKPVFIVLATIAACVQMQGDIITKEHPNMDHYALDYDTPTDPDLQSKLESVDANLRAKYGLTTEQTAVGLMDLQSFRVAMIHPDRMEYAASVPKVSILLTYFQMHPEAATNLDKQVRHELGMMAKASNNEMASKYSHQLGMKKIQEVILQYHLYDTNHGGGIWFGKHYGRDTERMPDPMSNLVHAATVRQLLRYWLWLEQGKLVSPEASRTMKEIFASPDIPHDDIKFVKGLDGRNLQILRKWGSYDTWYHDSADITGPGRHYVLVGLTKTPKGDDYLADLAAAVDDLMSAKPAPK